MNEPLNKIETCTCSRCGGTGHYSYNQITGTICFKCSGGKIVYTKRGRAAADYLHNLRCKPAKDFVVGDLMQELWGNPMGQQVRAFGKVVKVGWQEDAGGYYQDGVLKKYWVIELEHSKLGKMSKHVIGNELCRVGLSAEQKQATFKQALEFQATLGKNGKARKSKECAAAV